MSQSNNFPQEKSAKAPRLDAIKAYLVGSGWIIEDDGGRTSIWRLGHTEAQGDIRLVLPSNQYARDYGDRVDEALRVISFIERRLPQEIAADINFGGVDNVAVRLTPDAPEGEAPLFLACAAIIALRDFVVASAAALDHSALVLPPRRPQRAEEYASQARLSTLPGSFVLSLALPLADVYADDMLEDSAPAGQRELVQLPPQPFGRRVTNRMLAITQKAQRLAEDVGEGNLPLSSFGTFLRDSPNATELAALSTLGGPDYGVYQIRFARSPMLGGKSTPTLLRVTPGQQRILGDAADYLRTKQPRAGVTVNEGECGRQVRREG